MPFKYTAMDSDVAIATYAGKTDACNALYRYVNTRELDIRRFRGREGDADGGYTREIERCALTRSAMASAFTRKALRRKSDASVFAFKGFEVVRTRV